MLLSRYLSFMQKYQAQRFLVIYFLRIHLLISTILGFSQGVTNYSTEDDKILFTPQVRVPLMEIEDGCVYVMDGKYDMCNFCDQIREYNLEPFISSIILTRCYVLRQVPTLDLEETITPWTTGRSDHILDHMICKTKFLKY